jgi:hypothetical protein
MSAGHQLDRLSQRRVSRDRAVVDTVEPGDFRQHVRVPRITFGSRRRVPPTVAGHRHRVDREHLIPRRDQRGHPRLAAGLDRYLHQRGSPARLQLGPFWRRMLTDQRMQPRDPFQPFRQPRPGQPAPPIISDLDVMVVLRPVITSKQHPRPPSPRQLMISSAVEHPAI